MAVKPPLGSGERFKSLAAKTSPKLAAWIGMKKYGKARMQQMARAGMKRTMRDHLADMTAKGAFKRGK